MKLYLRSDDVNHDMAFSLAGQLRGRLLDSADLPQAGYLLEIQGETMSLLNLDDSSSRPFSVSFEPRFQARGQDPLRQALGKKYEVVFDLTAGWCADASAMVEMGARVTAFESNPLIFHMVKFALKHYQDPELQQNLHLINANGSNCVELASVPDVVYLDPMYPPRPGSAASPRAITLFRDIVNESASKSASSETSLLRIARDVAGYRVVVKRPHHAPPIEETGKVGEIRSKQLRFDLYAPNW